MPAEVRAYVFHVYGGQPLRRIGAGIGMHASNVSRRIRKVENRRDEPMVDATLDYLAQVLFPLQQPKETPFMTAKTLPSDEKIAREARRILRRLCEHDTYLLVSEQMEKGAVFKEVVPGRQTRLAVTPREVVGAFALNDWIAGDSLGSVARYTITPAGRKALKRMLLEDQQRKDSASDPFQDQHRVFGERVVKSYDGTGRESLRYNLAESPLSLLARKKDRSGAEYLSADLLEAGERFRADFERAQIGPRLAQNWERFMTVGGSNGWSTGSEGSTAAQERFSAALQALGPGLGDIALRVCCFLDGMERAEKRLGWAARSGKVVLKIALQRLAMHYGITEAEGMQEAG